MIKEWSAILYLEPVAKAAAKVAMVRGRVHKFTPAKTRKAMDDIRAALIAAKAPKFKGPIGLQVRFYIRCPKSISKKIVWPQTRPDLSNYLKLFEDAANGILWDDDSQIVEIMAGKAYADYKGNRIEVFVTSEHYE